MKPAPWSQLLPFLAASLLVVSGCTEDAVVVRDNLPEPKVDEAHATVSFVTNAPQLSGIAAEVAKPRAATSQRVTGRLSWDDDLTVRVFTPVSGRVVGLKANLGDMVARSGALAEIDSPDFGQALASARTAAANLSLADKAYQRSKGLLQHGAAAQKDVETAEAAYVAAQAERDRAGAVLANYGGSDKSTNSVYTLRSPLGGVLVEKNITPGQELRADLMLANAPNLCAPSFVVSDPGKLWLQLDVAESDMARFRRGQSLRVYSAAYPGRTFEGVLDNVADSLDSVTHTVKIRGVVDNPDKLLKAEMFVTVDVVEDVVVDANAGLVIPAQAAFLKGDKHYVFVQDQPGIFRRQEVAISEEPDGRVLVLNGLTAGERVVTDGSIFLEQLLE